MYDRGVAVRGSGYAEGGAVALVALSAVLSPGCAGSVSVVGDSSKPASKPSSTPVSRPAVDCRPSCVDVAEELAESQPARAVEEVERCLSCPSASPSAFLLAADLYGALRDGDSARRVLREGTGRFALNAGLWEALSRHELAADRREAALDAMATAHRLRPEDSRLEAAYLAMLVRFGSPADRAKVTVDALVSEASGQYALGDVLAARATLRKALSKSEGVPVLRASVRLQLGLMALSEQEFEPAEAFLEAARADARTDALLRADIDLARAEWALATGNYPVAEQAAGAAVAVRPTDPLGHVNLALALVHQGAVEKAVAALRSGLDRGLAARLTRSELEQLVAPAPWGPARSEVASLIAQAWRR